MRAFLFFLLCLTTACSSTQSRKRFSIVHTEVGTGYLHDKQYALAFRELFTAVELDPENAVAHNNLGLAYIGSNKNEEARQHFLKALSINPKYTDAKNNLGALYLKEKSYNQALDYLLQASKDLTYTETEKLNANIGIVYFQLRNYKNAQDFLKKAILADRKYCPAHQYYGPTLYHLNEYERAAKAIEHAIGLCSEQKYKELFFYGGLAYLKAGDTIKASAKWKELEALYPRSEYSSEVKKYQDILEKAL